MAPAPACNHCFGKELTEPSNLSDYDVNACGYYRLPADSYAAIDMGEPEVTPAMHAAISGPTSARTGGEIRFSEFGGNMTTPSMQVHHATLYELGGYESEPIPESTQASDDGALLHLGDQTTTPIAQAILGTAVVELIPISATVSNDGACNNECVIHCEGTTDAAQLACTS